MNEQMNPLDIEEIYESRFVYNGEAEGDILKNEIYQNLVKRKEKTNKIYIGEPAGLSKEHAFVSFENDFAENLLIVGSDQIKAASLFSYMAEQIEKTHNKNDSFYFFNFSMQLKTAFKNKIDPLLSENKNKLIDNKESETYLDEIYEEYKKRKELSDNNEEDKEVKFNKIYMFLYYIESSKLFSGASYSNKNIKKIEDIFKNGPELGMHVIIYAADFSTLTENDISREISKFKKKIALKGQNSLKIFGTEAGVSFSKSNNVAIIDRGIIGEDFKKFKPYVDNNFKIKKEE
jgi:hypothetical protein